MNGIHRLIFFFSLSIVHRFFMFIFKFIILIKVFHGSRIQSFESFHGWKLFTKIMIKCKIYMFYIFILVLKLLNIKIFWLPDLQYIDLSKMIFTMYVLHCRIIEYLCKKKTHIPLWKSSKSDQMHFLWIFENIIKFR